MKLKEWLGVVIPSDLYVTIISNNCGQITNSVLKILNNYHDVLEEEIKEVMINMDGYNGIVIITKVDSNINIKGKEYDVFQLKDNDIINDRWIVSNDSTSDEVCIRFYYITDKDLESLKTCRRLAELGTNENAIWVCCEEGDVFVCEYYHYPDGESFNGYKEFETVEAAMEWCDSHTGEEIHQLLSK